MIWALLALLGIPLWFIAVLLIAVFRSRKKVRSSPGVFRFVERTEKGWARRPGYGRWVSDVLIVHKGPALVRTEVQQVTEIEVHDRVEDPPKKLGESAGELVLTFADSSSRRISVAEADLETAVGGGVPRSSPQDSRSA